MTALARACLLREAWMSALILGAGCLSAGCRVDKIEVPAISLQGLGVSGLSGGVADLVLTVYLKNANDFEVTLVGITGGLELEGTEVGQVIWSGEHECPKQRDSALRIPLRFTVGENQRLFSALIDGPMPLRASLRGESTFAHGVIRRSFALAAEGKVGVWVDYPPPAADPGG